MKWFALLACLLLTTSAGARVNDPKDHSVTELVERYIYLPCTLLAHSYRFQEQELIHLSNHLNSCHNATEEHPEYKYGLVMCMYVQLQWQLMFDHLHSVEKAFDLMCYEDRQRREPEYEIDF